MPYFIGIILGLTLYQVVDGKQQVKEFKSEIAAIKDKCK